MTRRSFERQIASSLDNASAEELENVGSWLKVLFGLYLSGCGSSDLIFNTGLIRCLTRTDDTVSDLLRHLVLSYCCRYIDRPSKYEKNRSDIAKRIWFLSDRKFVSIVRMSSQSFFRLLNRIFFNPIFRNESYRAQEEIGAQLAITLDRFGHDGNGMSGVRLADFWKRSEGSVINYTGRVVKALLDLQEEYASWPTDEIRHAHSQVRKGAVMSILKSL
ncbi:MAG: hypothetical protein J3R72DRAFT_260743 [Linnemannia gamsii]|nr:MAG: hypothetical protein J3R72DRAFT_260743 [Linnemannia gamsii]